MGRTSLIIQGSRFDGNPPLIQNTRSRKNTPLQAIYPVIDTAGQKGNTQYVERVPALRFVLGWLILPYCYVPTLR